MTRKTGARHNQPSVEFACFLSHVRTLSHPPVDAPVGFPYNSCCFHHFRHERRDTSQLVVGCAHSCTNAVRNGHRSLAGRHKRSDLSQKASYSNRSDERRLSGHVWSCQDRRRVWSWRINVNQDSRPYLSVAPRCPYPLPPTCCCKNIPYGFPATSIQLSL